MTKESYGEAVSSVHIMLILPFLTGRCEYCGKAEEHVHVKDQPRPHVTLEVQFPSGYDTEAKALLVEMVAGMVETRWQK